MKNKILLINKKIKSQKIIFDNHIRSINDRKLSIIYNGPALSLSKHGYYIIFNFVTTHYNLSLYYGTDYSIIVHQKIDLGIEI